MSLSEGVCKHTKAKNTHNPHPPPPEKLGSLERNRQRDQTILFQVPPSQTSQKYQKRTTDNRQRCLISDLTYCNEFIKRF